MNDIALFHDLSLVCQPGAWCLVRWHEGHRCGPLSRLESMGGFGFPDGQVGMIARFNSREEAERAAVSPNGTRTAMDIPTLLEQLRFSVFVYCYYDGKTLTLRSDVEYQEARLICDAATGRAVIAERPGTRILYRVWMEDTLFLGTPPPLQLPQSELEERNDRSLTEG